MQIKSKKILFGLVCVGILAAITYAIVRASQSQVTDSFTDESKIASKTNITITGGQIRLFNCGDPVTFTYKGEEVTYYSTSSLGECWMDRNLGALQVATYATDSAAYGDLFQWGREDDDHQSITWTSWNSGTPDHPTEVEGDMTLTQQPGHSDFITEQTSPYDWATTTWTS